MKARLLSLLPALAIAVAGIVLLWLQRTEIAALTPSAARAAPRSPGGGPATEPVSRSSASSVALPVAITGEQRAVAFLAGLHEKARPLVARAESDAAANRARFVSDRAALLLSLTAEEKAALQKHLESKPAPGAAHDWIKEHCRAEQLAAFDAAESARRTATAEHEAQEAIYRMARIVDLTPEQKDRLYAGFVRTAAAAPAAEAAPMELRTNFDVTDTPRIEDPAALASPLLTREQQAFFDAALDQEGKLIRESTQSVMDQLMPVAIAALVEAAAGRQ